MQTAPASPTAPLLTALESAAGGALAPFGVCVAAGIDMPLLEVAPQHLLACVRALRDDAALSFEQLTYVTATDETPKEPRFRVIYHLYSFRHGWRLRVATSVTEEAPTVASLVSIYSGANWMEREVYDMFGIPFDGHPELRRILMPEGYMYHPLRKEFPLEGIAPDRLYREWEKEAHAEGAQEKGGSH